MKVVELKMLQRALGVTRQEKIKNKHIRGATDICHFEGEGKKGETEMVWTCRKG